MNNGSGATVTRTSGPTSTERASALGIDRVYDYTTTDPADQAELQGTFDVVHDTSGSLPVRTAVRPLNKTGLSPTRSGAAAPAPGR
ncbi:hypothetical protein [Streptomyces sp. NPDC001480]|uniref:hypothetical protein n=1 Tax=Streptomyces sp. NPDC001480 TaxID=3364577 RepID=UPI0036BD5D43